jgi:hypothetical protein
MTPSFDRLEITEGSKVPPILLGRHTPAIEVKVSSSSISSTGGWGAVAIAHPLQGSFTDYRRFGALAPTPRFDPARSLARNCVFSYLAQGGLDQ